MAAVLLSAALPASPAPRAGRPFVAAAAAGSYRLLGVMVALVALLVPALGFTVAGIDLQVMALVQLFAVASALLLRRRGLGRLATAIEAVVLVLAASMATACLSVLLATIALPYRDATLAAIDAAAFPFVTWRGMFVALHDHHRLVAAMSGIYQTLLWQPFLLVALLALSGRDAACWRFVHAWYLTLAACLVVFPFVTAVSPYAFYGIAHADIPALGVDTGWWPARLLDDIRSGALRELSPHNMTGLISVPSFHAGAATLLFWGFRRVPLLGPAFMVLNVAMAATAPLIGAHYFIDIVAGVAVAAGAIRVAEGRRLTVAPDDRRSCPCRTAGDAGRPSG